MNKNAIETVTGAVVLAVAASFLLFAYKNSQMSLGSGGYHVTANFANAAGLSSGSDVKIGGVKIGVVSDLGLDPQSYEAVTTLELRKDVAIPTDSSAAIVSSGLLGDKFVEVAPGGEEAMLKDGGKIEFTQSSVNLEQMIGKFMFSGGGVDKGKDDKAAPTPPGDEGAAVTP